MRITPFEKLNISNAGGMVKSLEDVLRFCVMPATRIVVGGITFLERVGNEPVAPGDVVFLDLDTDESGNSIGLKNIGMEKYRAVLPRMVAEAHAHGKELWVNVNGESVEEIIELVLFCFLCGVDGVEINLACPNVHDKGVQKPLFCENPLVVEHILHRLAAEGLRGKKISIKISPTDDDLLVTEVCDVIRKVDVLTEIVGTNTRGGQRFVRNGVDMIAFRPPGSNEVKHVGGQAGRPLHKRAVEIVTLLRAHAPEHIRVTGVGGNLAGLDAYDFVRAGADGIQMATAILKSGPRALADITYELAECYP